MSEPEFDRAARLLERLLLERELRAAFRRDPAAVLRDHGLEALAEELSGGAKSLYTLELRESKSSLAGVFMAAAAEGVGVFELARYLEADEPLPGGVAQVVSRALSSPRIQAVTLSQQVTPGVAAPEAAAAAEVSPPGPVAPPAAEPPAEPPVTEPPPAEPPPPAQAQPDEAAAPTAETPPPAAESPPAAEPQVEAEVEPASALAGNPRLELPPEGDAALTSGEVDPRAAALLTRLLERHDLRLRTLDGDGFEIAAVDGEPVTDVSIAARELVEELAGLGPGARPSAIFAPWAIDDPAFSATAADRIVVLFDAPVGAGGRESAVFDAVGPSGSSAADGTLSLPTPDEQPQADAPPAEAPAPAAAGPDEPPPVGVGTPPEAPGDVAALLADTRLTLPPAARADFEAGLVDPRLVGVLNRLLEKHDVGLSVVVTGHDKFTSGGSISNHFVGRGLDIATVDGVPVSPTNEAARQVALELAELDPALRPTEVGAPWSIGAAGFFTDGGHLDHIHVAYDDPPPAGFVLPETPPPALAAEAVPGVPGSDPAAAGRASAVFAGVPAGGPGPHHDTLGVAPAAPMPDDVVDAPVAPPPAGLAAPIAPEDLANTNAGGHLHGSEFAVPDAEGAANADGPPLHAGYDLFARAGAPVRSPISGTIVEVTESRGSSGQIFGGVVKIQGENGEVWVFRHVDPASVTEGTAVEAGALVASITAWTDGPPHSHVELWRTLEGGYNVSNMRDPLEELEHAYPPGTPALEPEHVHGAGEAHAGEAAGTAAGGEEAPPQPVEEPEEQPPPSEGRASAVFDVVTPSAEHHPVRSTVQFLPTVRPEEQVPGEQVPEEPEVPALVSEADVVAYPGDDAPREAVAAWMAGKAVEAGLPPELPVMAALVESGLKNLNYGDADSVGFFQMRLSIWDQGTYAGYAERPELQLQWFLDHAVALKEQRVSDGALDFGADDGTWGQWIADVERPAAEYRYRYQEKLEEARALLRR